MRRFAILLCVLASSAAAQNVPVEGDVAPGGVGGDHRPCDFQGKRLMGRVRVVESFPDFRVKLEDDKKFAELHARRVTRKPEICGEWEFVDGMPDFTIAFVDYGEDFKIAWVENEPGIPEDPVMPSGAP